jgi:hypothetical protein
MQRVILRHFRTCLSFICSQQSGSGKDMKTSGLICISTDCALDLSPVANSLPMPGTTFPRSLEEPMLHKNAIIGSHTNGWCENLRKVCMAPATCAPMHTRCSVQGVATVSRATNILLLCLHRLVSQSHLQQRPKRRGARVGVLSAGSGGNWGRTQAQLTTCRGEHSILSHLL